MSIYTGRGVNSVTDLANAPSDHFARPQLTRNPMQADTKSRSWDMTADASGIAETKNFATNKRISEHIPMEDTIAICSLSDGTVFEGYAVTDAFPNSAFSASSGAANPIWFFSCVFEAVSCSMIVRPGSYESVSRSVLLDFKKLLLIK